MVSSWATPPSSSLPRQQLFRENRDRPACAFWSLSWGIQIFRGRWEAQRGSWSPGGRPSVILLATHSSHFGLASCCSPGSAGSGFHKTCALRKLYITYKPARGLLFFLTPGTVCPFRVKLCFCTYAFRIWSFDSFAFS